MGASDSHAGAGDRGLARRPVPGHRRDRAAGSDGNAEPRNDGASLEHYSLCRCGKSQNKPFCSGMHWYADFHDPPTPEQATLFQWAGGFPALLRLTRRFYEVHVPQDPLLSGLFSQMSPDHPERVASWLGQVFGGPPAYSERYGEYDRMISQHLDKALTPSSGHAGCTLLARSADEVGLPNDAEFRAAFTAYLEWGSRIALENSQPGVHPPPHMPVPRWWWVCDAYPWSRPHASERATRTGAAAASFQDPRSRSPSRPTSSRCSANATANRCASRSTSGRTRTCVSRGGDPRPAAAGTMPCDGAWPPERVDVFERWVNSGMAP